MDTNEFWQLAGKYFSEEITDTEKEKLFLMLEQFPELKEEFEETQKLWSEAAHADEDYDAALLQRTLNKIEGNEEAPELPQFGKRRPVYRLEEASSRNSRKWIAAAVVIGIVGLVGYWLFLQSKTSFAPVEWVTATVEPGHQKKIVLPDGSEIRVNAGSSIEYPKAFTDSIREIRIKGEAFFNVISDPNKPFIVKAGSLTTRVLGTSFNVRAYPNENTSSVIVATGKVQVADKNTVLNIVEPDQWLVYDEKDKLTTINKRSFETMDWQQNRMAFDDISFKDLAAELGRRYNKQFIFKDSSLQYCHYRVYFNNMPLEQMMQQLSLTNGFTYIIKQNSILLQGSGCQ